MSSKIRPGCTGSATCPPLAPPSRRDFHRVASGARPSPKHEVPVPLDLNRPGRPRSSGVLSGVWSFVVRWHARNEAGGVTASANGAGTGVRVFPDPKTGLFQIEWREDGRRLSRSLKHRDGLGRRSRRVRRRLARQSGSQARAVPRHHDRAAMKMFLGCFGRDRKPATLSQRDWDRFIRERRAGKVGPSGKPVSDRMIERGT